MTENRKVHIVPNIDTYEVSLVDVPAIGEKFTIFQFAVDKLYRVNNSKNWKVINNSENTKVADEEYQWDATSARERIVEWARNEAGEIDFDKFEKAFLIYDRSNSENIDGYKYPIADIIDGELRVVPRAVYASAILSLGIGVSESNRESLRHAIGSYYRLLDESPPWNEEVRNANWKTSSVPEGVPIADKSRSWDESAARTRIAKWASSDGSGDKEKIDWSKYRKAFLLYDSENVENITSYKFPVADVIDGSLKIVPKAVFTAARFLDRAKISSETRSNLQSKIGTLYKRMDETPPWKDEKTTQNRNNKETDEMDEKDVTQEVENEEVVENTVLDETKGVTDNSEGVDNNTVSATESTESVTDKTKGVTDEEEVEVETEEVEEETVEESTEEVETEEVETETEEETEEEEVQLRSDKQLHSAIKELTQEIARLRERMDEVENLSEEVKNSAVEATEEVEETEEEEKVVTQNRESQMESPLDENEENEKDSVDFNGLYSLDPLGGTRSRIRESLQRIYKN